MIAQPIGARILVLDIEPETDLVARGRAAGLSVVVLEQNAPKPTSGRVVAVGSDPLIQELVSIGDVVTFGRNSGVFCQVEGTQYRALDLNDIILVLKPTLQEQAPPQSEEPPRSTL